MKKVIKNILVLPVLLSVFSLTAQTEENAKNTIYGELFGQGLGGSICYDKLITKPNKTNSHTFGVTYIPESMQFGDGRYIGGHYSYNFIFGKKSHHLELGLGVTVLHVKPAFLGYNGIFSYLTPKLGYRYQRTQGGVFFRGTALPMIALANIYYGESLFFREMFANVADLNGTTLFPWLGVSFGYTFKQVQ